MIKKLNKGGQVPVLQSRNLVYSMLAAHKLR